MADKQNQKKAPYREAVSSKVRRGGMRKRITEMREGG